MVDYLNIKPALTDKPDYLAEHFIGLTAIIGDAANADGGYLPQVIIIDLGNSHIELASYPGGNGL